MSFAANRALPIALVFVLGSLWGLHLFLIKICSESGLPHFAILMASTIGVCLAFQLVCVFRKHLPRYSGRHLRFYIVCAALGYVGPILIELVVAKHMDAGLLTLIVSTTPLLTVVIATVLKTESVRIRGLIGVILGCVAILMLLWPKLNGTETIAWRIVALTFVVPICYGIYHNYVAKAWPPGSNTWQVAGGEMAIAALALLPIYLWQFGAEWISPLFPQQQWQGVHWAIAVMVLFAVLEVYLYFEIIRLAGAVTVSLSNFVTIAAGVVWGMLIFAETPGWWDWFCVLILMLALYLVLGKRRFNTTITTE